MQVAVVCMIFVLSILLMSLANAETNTVTSNPTLVWKTAIDNPIRSAPDVVDGILYIGSYNGTVFAINAENGTIIWSSTPGQGGINTDDSTPVVVNGTVYISSTGTGTVYALDAKTGTVLWSRATIPGSYCTAPVVVNGIIYVGTFNFGGILALKASTGALLWNSTALDSDWGVPSWIAPHSGIGSPPAVVNSVVYFGSENGLSYALDASSGHMLWSINSTDGSVYSSPVVTGGIVYVTVCDFAGPGNEGSGLVYAVDASTGAPIWNVTIAPLQNESPVVVDGIVYVSGFNGNVYALRASNGSQIWNTTAGNYFEYKSYPGQYALTSPVLANGVIYLGSQDDLVYGLNAVNGSLLWTYKTGNGILSPPTIVNEELYVASTDGNIYAFDISSASASATPTVNPSPTVPEFSTIVVILPIVAGIIAVILVRLQSVSKHKQAYPPILSVELKR